MCCVKSALPWKASRDSRHCQLCQPELALSMYGSSVSSVCSPLGLLASTLYYIVGCIYYFSVEYAVAWGDIYVLLYVCIWALLCACKMTLLSCLYVDCYLSAVVSLKRASVGVNEPVPVPCGSVLSPYTDYLKWLDAFTQVFAKPWLPRTSTWGRRWPLRRHLP